MPPRSTMKSIAAPAGVEFLTARPIWPAGREREMNLLVGFRARFDAGRANRTILRLTASSIYRAFLNGEFLGYGPARGPRGWFRVDEWDLTGRLKSGKNIVAVEVAGYNVGSYYLLDQPAFLQAEIVADDGKTLAATGRSNSFECHILDERVQKVQRYSYQRPFSEVYRLRRDSSRWRADASAKFSRARCAELPPKPLLRRGVSYPTFERLSPAWHVARGRMRTGVQPERIVRPRYLTQIGPLLKGFVEAELDCAPFLELQTVASATSEKLNRPFNADTVRLSGDSYHILDFGVNRTGFLGATIRCRKPTRLFFTFDEILTKGDVDFLRYDCVNIVTYELPAGEFHVESFEPYTLRYLKLITLGGDCELRGLYLREYAAPDVWRAQFACADPRLNRIFEAGRETFRQNAVDLFTDCPGRERAGWLCDSFFTARAAIALMGHAGVEHNFCENYLLPKSFPQLPDGMLPMCYPADHPNGNFIPNWALWFVVELEEYLARSGDRAMVDALEPKVRRLFDYFAENFRNSDGLLEKLERWVFIEWSEAQSFMQDVNYPSNMLYAGALAAAGRMYGDRKLLRQAQQVRRAVIEQSFDGHFFVDNAVRQDGKLRVTTNRTEVCQYFAFFFDLATPKNQPQLWRTLCEKFGPRRDLKKTFPDVHPANAFIGVMLRLQLLSRYGRCRQMLDESIDYWLCMAEATGTLWEHLQTTASCNHGFTSHVCHALYRDVLGPAGSGHPAQAADAALFRSPAGVVQRPHSHRRRSRRPVLAEGTRQARVPRGNSGRLFGGGGQPCRAMP